MVESQEPKELGLACVLRDNFKRKANAMYGETPDGERHFERLSPLKSEKLKANRTEIHAWMMTFCASRVGELIRLTCEAGFGSRNAQGFGRVRVNEGG